MSLAAQLPTAPLELEVPDLDVPVFEVAEMAMPEVAWLLPALLAVGALLPLLAGLVPARALGVRLGPRLGIGLGEHPLYLRLVRWRIFPGGLQWLVLLAFAAVLALLRHDERVEGILPPGLAVVWGVWWNLFLLSLLVAGRAWCSVCPVFFLSNKLPHLPLRAPLPQSPIVGAVVYLGLGIAFAALGIEGDVGLTVAMLVGLIAGGVLLNRLTPGLYWCRFGCPAVLFARLFGSSSLVKPRSREPESFGCVLSGGPVADLGPEGPHPSACSFCLRCGKVAPELALGSGSGLPAEPPAVLALLAAGGWAGTVLEVARSRAFWPVTVHQVEQLGLPGDLAATAAVGLGLTLALLAASRLCARGHAISAPLEASLPLLMAAVGYMVLFSGSLHWNWVLLHAQRLFGLEADAAYRLREGLYAPPLLNEPTLGAAALVLVAGASLHSLRAWWRDRRAGRAGLAALVLLVLLAAALALLLTRPYLSRGC